MIGFSIDEMTPHFTLEIEEFGSAAVDMVKFSTWHGLPGVNTDIMKKFQHLLSSITSQQNDISFGQIHLFSQLTFLVV